VTRGVTTTVAGLLITGCALVAAAGAAVPGRRLEIFRTGRRAGQAMLSHPTWYWPGWFWVITAGLAVAGLVVAARPAARPAARRRAAAVAAVLAAQIAGRAIVGVRDWFNANGAGQFTLAPHQLATMVTIAAAIAMAGTAAACVAVALLWREPVRGWAAWRPRTPALVVGGAAVALLLPLPIAAISGAAAVTQAGSVALSASLPWGGALAAAAWLGPRARRCTVRTVIACAVVTALSLGVTVAMAAAGLRVVGF
jgi:hypothetical protein